MFLSGVQYSELDSILKEFEVGIRGYVCTTILNKYTTVSSFTSVMEELRRKFDTSALAVRPMMMQKYFSKVSKWSKQSSVKELYQAMVFTNECFKRRELFDDDNVPYVSDIIDLIILFYNPDFLSFSGRFDSPEVLESYLLLFHRIRNTTSHPASKRVSYEDARELIQFILMCLTIIDSDYFWFVDPMTIKLKINDFLSKLDGDIGVLHNLNETNQKNYKKLLLRDNELDMINQYLVGYRRSAGSVLLHGYGGVGKTAVAIEFCYNLLKRAADDDKKYDFIIWTSSKEEELVYDRGGVIKIRNIRPQYSTFDDFLDIVKNVLKLDLSSSCDDVIHYFESVKSGLIVIDNFETIKDEDRNRFRDFIYSCPNKVQFLLTSREYVDIADKHVEIKGFREYDIGIKFIQDYCSINSYEYDFDDADVKVFLEESCGNTLVLTLMLNRIFEGKMDLKSTINSLRQSTRHEVEVIADFMYKNMFDSVIKELEEKYPSIRNVLNIMLLYREPIDFYSLKELTLLPAKHLEEILSIFVRKYIVDLVNGLYELNEMAIKFVALKLIPDNNTVKQLINSIDEHKKAIESALSKLLNDKDKYDTLRPIIDDWQPTSKSETIAIAQAYQMYGECAKKLGPSYNRMSISMEAFDELLNKIREEFDKISDRSGHPYIKFQKARILKLFLEKIGRDNPRFNELLDEINSSYDNAYVDIYTRYTNILSTQSYCAFLMLYGIFQLVDRKRYSEAVKYLEDASARYENIHGSELNKANCYFYLSNACCFTYLETEQKAYLQKATMSIIEAVKYFQKLLESNPKHKQKLDDLYIMNLFVQCMTNNIKKGEAKAKLKDLNTMRKHLRPLIEKIKLYIFYEKDCN